MSAWRLIPEFSQLSGFIQVLFAMALLSLAGRALLRGSHGVAVSLMAGWGAYAALMTLWGMVTAASLRIPGAVFILAVLAAQIWAPARPSRADLAEAGRVLLLAASLLWVMADIRPSQSDNLAVMLPNTAYLFDWAHFPTQDGPPVYTDVPVAPYNFHLLSFLGSLPFHAYAANSPSLVTVFLHLAAGLLLATALAGGKRPGWGLTAFGLALATILNPGFVPRVSFSGYAEAPLAIALLFCVWLALQMIEALAEGHRPSPWPLALAEIVLILIKQQGIGLFAAFLGAVLVTAALDRRIGPRRALIVLGGSALPAIALYYGWRIYVGTAFPAGELRAMPFSLWQWGLLPEILYDIGRVVLRHFPYFGLAGLAAGLAAARPRWLGEDSRRALAITLLAVLAYNLFLLLTFVGHFQGEHSFFRYNTHQSLMLVLALGLAARDLWLRAPRPWAGKAGQTAIALMLAVPPAASPLLRFDRDMPQPRMDLLADQLGTALSVDEKRLALILPDDNASARDALASLLRSAPGRRPLLEIASWNGDVAGGLAEAARQGYRVAALSCTDGNHLGLPPDSAALLVFENGNWRADRVWPYPPPPKRSWWNWTAFIASEPFCLKR